MGAGQAAAGLDLATQEETRRAKDVPKSVQWLYRAMGSLLRLRVLMAQCEYGTRQNWRKEPPIAAMLLLLL
jgi:hypothetical protein